MVSQLLFKNKISQISGHSFINMDLIISLFLFLLTFIVYMKYLAPTIFTGDSADATMASYFLGIPHPPGLPVYTWIGHLFTFIPVGDIAYRVNIMSAFFGALAIPVVYMIIRIFALKSKDGFENFASRCGAILGSLSLAFSIYYWSSAEIAEINTLYSFFIASMIILVLIWVEKKDIRSLYLLSLIFGLSIGTYATIVLYIPSFLVFLYLVDSKVLMNKKVLVSMIGIFIAIGLIQLLYLYIRALQAPVYTYVDIRNINAFLNFITAREYSNMPFSLPLSQGIGLYFTYLLSNVSLVGVVVGAIGIGLSLKRNILWSAFLASLLVINIFFFAQYNSFDIHEKFIPSYMIFSIFIGLCIWEILSLFRPTSDYKPSLKTGKKGNKLPLKTGKKGNKLLLETGKRKYFLGLISISLVLIITAYIPLISYVSHSQEADRSGSADLPYFLTNVLNEVPPDSTIIDVWQIVEPLKYFQLVYHINPTVEVFGASSEEWPDRIQERINRNDVYLVRENQNLMNKYSEIPVLTMPGVGTLYKVYSSNPSFSVTDPATQHPVKIIQREARDDQL